MSENESRQTKLAIITCNNLISRVMVSRFLKAHSELVPLIVVVPNFELRTKRGKRLMKKWMNRTTVSYLIYKFVEIYVDTFFSKIGFRSIENIASRHHIKIIKLKDHSEDALFIVLSRVRPDFLLSMGHAVLTQKVIQIPRIMTLNVHGGDIPKYRGMGNYVWMLGNNEKIATVTLHEVVERIDAGRVILKSSFRISNNWSAFRLNYEMGSKGALVAIKFFDKYKKNGFVNFLKDDPDFERYKYNSTPDRAAIKRLKKYKKRLIDARDVALIFKRI